MTHHFASFLRDCTSLTAGVVYSFQPAETPSELWYDRWHSEVLSTYGQSLQLLGVEPYYVDVNTFCAQAFAGQLPNLSYVFNLNAGIRPISNWALVPATCSWLQIPVLPCTADNAIIGERKDISNLLAKQAGFNTPQAIDISNLTELKSDELILEKARDLGGSAEISLTTAGDLVPQPQYLYQEFIPGYDLTIPIIFDPFTAELKILPGVLYVPEDEPDPRFWYHSRETKLRGSGYNKNIVPIPRDRHPSLLQLARQFEVQTYCRLDLRLRAEAGWTAADAFREWDLVFMEMNVMPTIRLGINYLNGMKAAIDEDDFPAYKVVRDRVGADSTHLLSATLLASAMYGVLRAKRGGRLEQQNAVQ